jgi:hypothetical protein
MFTEKKINSFKLSEEPVPIFAKYITANGRSSLLLTENAFEQ